MSDEPDGHILRRWISVGDVLTLVVSLTVMAFGYGRLSRDVESLTRAMEELQMRDMTPGARAQLSAIQATDAAMQQQINDLRVEMREERREVVEAITRMEAKFDRHAERNR